MHVYDADYSKLITKFKYLNGSRFIKFDAHQTYPLYVYSILTPYSGMPVLPLFEDSTRAIAVYVYTCTLYTCTVLHACMHVI